jgi:hypothetical protein
MHWPLAYALSLCNLEEMMAERGLSLTIPLFNWGAEMDTVANGLFQGVIKNSAGASSSFSDGTKIRDRFG